MAAVLPFLEEFVALPEEDREYLDAARRAFSGLGVAIKKPPDPERSLRSHHAAQISLAAQRQYVYDWFERNKVSYRVQFGDHNGQNTDEVYFVLSRPFTREDANPLMHVSVSISSVGLFSDTTKMNCPSYSLPSGPPNQGGTCPGAVVGQSTSPTRPIPVFNLVKKYQPEAASLTDEHWYGHSICQMCYAQGGRFVYLDNHIRQIVRYDWTRKALHRMRNGRTEFEYVILEALARVEFRNEGKKNRSGEWTILPEPEMFRAHKFFRIHDSGDFFNHEYFTAWKHIADERPDILFWAPTRTWCVPGWIEHINRVNNPPRNFIVRPSAYHIEKRPEGDLGPGWAAWTTVGTPAWYAQQVGLYDCPAYKSEKVSCRSAQCRACWVHPYTQVNYSLHV